MTSYTQKRSFSWINPLSGLFRCLIKYLGGEKRKKKKETHSVEKEKATSRRRRIRRVGPKQGYR